MRRVRGKPNGPNAERRMKVAKCGVRRAIRIKEDSDVCKIIKRPAHQSP